MKTFLLIFSVINFFVGFLVAYWLLVFFFFFSNYLLHQFKLRLAIKMEGTTYDNYFSFVFIFIVIISNSLFDGVFFFNYFPILLFLMFWNGRNHTFNLSSLFLTFMFNIVWFFLPISNLLPRKKKKNPTYIVNHFKEYNDKMNTILACCSFETLDEYFFMVTYFWMKRGNK